MYDKNCKILFVGDFNDDKVEGYGKLYYENGQYYIGQFANDKRYGKGKICDINGKILYEGDFFNDKSEFDDKNNNKNCYLI